MVQILLEDGRIDPNITDDNGMTPFNTACYNDRYGTVQILLDNPKIDFNKADNSGRTPFFNACYMGRDGIIELLRNHEGIDCTKTDNSGRSPLDSAYSMPILKIIELMALTSEHKNTDAEPQEKLKLSIAVPLLSEDEHVYFNELKKMVDKNELLKTSFEKN